MQYKKCALSSLLIRLLIFENVMSKYVIVFKSTKVKMAYNFVNTVYSSNVLDRVWLSNLL